MRVSAGNDNLCILQQKPGLKDFDYNQQKRGGFILPEVHTDSGNILLIVFFLRTVMAQSKVNLFEQNTLNCSRITSVLENCLDTPPSFEYQKKAYHLIEWEIDSI